jgi:hypothetical protein
MFDKIQFELTEQHLKLIRRMNVRYDDYCEFGAPMVDPKRPYGNSSVYHDIGEILDISPTAGDPDDLEFTEEQEDTMLALHKETATALQVIIAAGSFELGTYEAGKYDRNWTKV